MRPASTGGAPADRVGIRPKGRPGNRGRSRDDAADRLSDVRRLHAPPSIAGSPRWRRRSFAHRHSEIGAGPERRHPPAAASRRPPTILPPPGDPPPGTGPPASGRRSRPPPSFWSPSLHWAIDRAALKVSSGAPTYIPAASASERVDLTRSLALAAGKKIMTSRQLVQRVIRLRVQHRVAVGRLDPVQVQFVNAPGRKPSTFSDAFLRSADTFTACTFSALRSTSGEP